ncbi:M28 family peptidase [Lachnospiraceae bacterium 45-P1]
MEEMFKFREFSEKIAGGLEKDRMMKDIEAFSHLERYTGSREGEQAAEMIATRMESLGIPVSRETYRIYRSLPGKATVKVLGQGIKEEIALTPYVYSGQAESIQAELVFDGFSVTGCTQKQMKERMKAFAGKIVLTYESSFSFACEAKNAGALGILTIWRANLAHHGTLGGVWGSPEPEDLNYHYPRIPFAEICKDDGERLKELCTSAKEPVSVCLNIEMDDGILPTMMPVARIEGKSRKFVLVSGHYDSWYEGVTDNGVANAAMMEMARVFKENQEKLERSVVFAWWSGHSDGRYSGSTWYYDNHWQELNEDCVAHINMDICGCKGSDLVGFNTSMLEGEEFAKEFLKEFNDGEPIPPVPMARFADQTFWGANVPFAIMPKFSKKDKVIFYWWHTKEDTFDKVDGEIVLRDAKVIAKLSAIFANIDRLPADMKGFAEIMEQRLIEMNGALSSDFDLAPVWPAMERLKETIARFEAKLPQYEPAAADDAVIKVAGEMVRITYTASSRYHQDPATEGPMFPALSMAMGLTPENTEEDFYLAVQTRFVRQRNRLVGQLWHIMEDCENLMRRLDMERQTS